MESKNIVVTLPIAVDVGAIEAAVEKAATKELQEKLQENIVRAYFDRGYRGDPTQAMEKLVDRAIDSIFNTETKKAEITELVADRLVEKLSRSKKFREGVSGAIDGGAAE